MIRSAVALACHAVGVAVCCWRASWLPAAAIAAHTDFWQRCRLPAPQYSLANGCGCLMCSSLGMSRSKYWYQPLNCPPGGESNTLTRLLNSPSRGPSSGRMKAAAIFGHAASMMAAPGLSILPSPLRSSRLPPALRQATSSDSIFAACALGALVPLSSSWSTGTVRMARTSCVAEAFIAEVRVARDHLPCVRSRARL